MGVGRYQDIVADALKTKKNHDESRENFIYRIMRIRVSLKWIIFLIIPVAATLSFVVARFFYVAAAIDSRAEIQQYIYVEGLFPENKDWDGMLYRRDHLGPNPSALWWHVFWGGSPYDPVFAVRASNSPRSEKWVLELKDLDAILVYPDSNPISKNFLERIASKNQQLRKLSISQLEKNGLEKIAEFRRLRFLELSHSKILAKELSKVLDDIELDTLKLNSCEIDKECCEIISKHKSLVWLELKNTRLENRDFAVLSKLENLEHLDLTGTLLKDDVASQFVNCTKLKTLIMDGTEITGESLAMLLGKTGLNRLSLSHTPLDQRRLKGLVTSSFVKNNDKQTTIEIHGTAMSLPFLNQFVDNSVLFEKYDQYRIYNLLSGEHEFSPESDSVSNFGECFSVSKSNNSLIIWDSQRKKTKRIELRSSGTEIDVLSSWVSPKRDILVFFTKINRVQIQHQIRFYPFGHAVNLDKPLILCNVSDVKPSVDFAENNMCAVLDSEKAELAIVNTANIKKVKKTKIDIDAGWEQCTLSPNGKFIALSNLSTTAWRAQNDLANIQVLSVSTGGPTEEYVDVSDFAFNEEDESIAFIRSNRTKNSLIMGSEETTLTKFWPNKFVSAKLSTHGKYLAVVHTRGLSILNLETNKVVVDENYRPQIEFLMFSHNEKFLLVGGYE